MKNVKSKIVEHLIYEMQLRNYSVRTIDSYGKLLTKVEKSLELPLDKIGIEQFKSYLHQRIMQDEVSTSMVNQLISAYKILQVDVLKRDWQTITLKRPRREKKLPIVLSVEEVQRMISSTKNLKHRALIMLVYSAGMRKHINLDANEFIRRFLQHVLPSGFCKIRYFGFLALRNMKQCLSACFQLIATASYLPSLVGLCALDVWRTITGQDPIKCPKCAIGKLQPQYHSESLLLVT